MSSSASTNREYAQWLADAFKEVDWVMGQFEIGRG
jgi:hypothetical protein